MSRMFNSIFAGAKSKPLRSIYKHYVKKQARDGNRFEIMSITPKNFNYPLHLRKGTPDVLNYVQIFVSEEYSFLPFPPKTILDLGGYIGLASVYLAQNYPDARILCVEPDFENYLFAKINTRPFPNVKCINVGAWSETCFIVEDKRFPCSMGDDCGISFKATTHGEIPDQSVKAMSIPDLMNYTDFSEIDFLKIDIEGSEKVLFSSQNAGEWIDKCKIIACELHDRFVPGCSRVFHRAMQGRGLNYGKYGELDYYFRN